MADMAKRLLVVEDDRDIAELMALHLRDLQHEVEVVEDARVALDRALGDGFDLIVLDLMLPGGDGLEICRRLRSREIHTPILMLTARSAEIDRVLGLELGADDYVTKPFSIRELQARVKALLRRSEMPSRSPGPAGERIEVGDLAIDLDKRAVTVAGAPVELTAKEFDLLAQFARYPGRVYSRAQLLDLVWGHAHAGYEHTVNSHINRLRAKIERNPARPDLILTVWGVGYKFNDAAAH
jgi:DNA-binding response OmpR family regulator